MNSESSKISVPHRLLHNLPDKRNLNGTVKYIALSNFSIHMEIYKKVMQEQWI